MSAGVEVTHDPDCPLGVNGLRAYGEARDALSSLPPECRRTQQDLEDIACAEFQLEAGQVCRCGFAAAVKFWERYKP